MKLAFLLTPLAALTLAGCVSSPAYRCPMDGGHPTGGCNSTEQAYKAAVASRGTHQQVTSVFDLPQNRQGNAPDAAAQQAPYFTGQAANYPTPPGNGAPVFQQPKVFQPWLAPYVDAEGNLRSGEYGYFSTPGRWNYGTLRKPGSSSDIFEPAKPGDLGFQAVAPAAKGSAKPSAPPAGATTAQGSQAATSQTTNAAPVNPSAITQPYKRLQTE